MIIIITVWWAEHFKKGLFQQIGLSTIKRWLWNYDIELVYKGGLFLRPVFKSQLETMNIVMVISSTYSFNIVCGSKRLVKNYSATKWYCNLNIIYLLNQIIELLNQSKINVKMWWISDIIAWWITLLWYNSVCLQWLKNFGYAS